MYINKGAKIDVCLGIINPERNYLNGKKAGAATKVEDSASKKINIENSSVDVKIGEDVIYRDINGNWFRKYNGRDYKIDNFEERLQKRGINTDRVNER